MAKKSKVLSKSAIAAALSVSAIVPVAAIPAAAESASSVTEVVYVVNGQNVSLSFEDFTSALNVGALKDLDIKYVKTNTDKFYSFENFSSAFNATENGTVDEVFALLETKPEFEVSLTDVVEGTIGKEGNVEAPKTAELTVQSVSAIDETGVTVTFEALTEAQEGAKITVVDPSGSTVEVTPVNLEVGDTTVTFDFVTAYEELPLGVFKVQGKDFDTAAVAAVAAVNTAGNVVELWEALQSTYFTGVVEENIEDYDGELDGTQTTVAEIQAIIDEVNQGKVDAEAEGTVVKKVADATNVLQLLNALKDPAFTRVNADWITDYSTENVVLADNTDMAPSVAGLLALGSVNYFGETKGATIEAIQAAIDAENTAKATTAVGNAEGTLSLSDIADAKSLVNTYVPEDVEGDTTKKDLLDRLAVHEAVVNVTLANTNAKLTAALTALDNLSDDFDVATVNPNELTRYRTDITTAKATVTNVNTATLIQGIITAANGDAEDDAVDAVANVSATATSAQVKTLLTTLADRSAFASEDFDGTTVIDALLEDYRDAIVGAFANDPLDVDTAAEIQGLVTAANSPTAALTTLVDAGNALTDADKLLAALKAKTLNLTVTDANKAAYFEDIAAVKVAAGSNADAVQAVINATDARVALNAATTDSAAQTALTKFAIATSNTTYINLSSTAKLEVAGLVLAEKPANGYAANTAVTAEIGTQNTARTGLLAGVNNAADIDAMNTALKALDYAAYTELSELDKITVAEAFLNAFPQDDNGKVNYTTLTAIKADLDKVIAQ
ncbi:hypothetical protein [Lysinibacillus endophyticus]|uniref:hypothetical protein n=1 Tax=Ureibacillus endophyticus TaxID=1978490 RepID=UPI0020A1925C|nr:hypothetical protein [Lysinibacillus endophyticus]MCP1143650.1 hypothetical protein [Lysinibacillus endophyticus]